MPVRRYIRQLADHYAAHAVRLDAERDAARAARDAERARVKARDRGPNPERNPFKEWDGDPYDLPPGKSLFELDEEANDGAFFEYMEEVERALDGPPPGARPLAEHAGVDLAELPAPADLSDAEAQLLHDVLARVCFALNHSLGFELQPDTPPQVYYGAVVEMLAAPAMIPDDGHFGFDCEEWAPNCAYGRYCGCLRYFTRNQFIVEGGEAAGIPPEHFKSMDEEIAERQSFWVRTYRDAQPRTDVHGDVFDADHAQQWPASVRIGLDMLQGEAHLWIEEVGKRYFSELTNTAILAEEVGEVARLAARLFGDQSFKNPDDAARAREHDWMDELGDVLFVLTCLANQTGVDLSTAWSRGMRKRTERDRERHARNKKGERGNKE